jgi:hypothetical protein
VSWRVFATNESQPDFDKLSEADRAALDADLFGWVEHGPPRINRRIVGGARFFEDAVPSGLVVTYFVNETVPYVAILRVRRRF